MTDNKQNKTIKNVIFALFVVISAAFIAMVMCRKLLFPADSFLYNVYEEEAGFNGIFISLFKTVVIIVGGWLVIQAAKVITKIGNAVSDNTVKTATLLIGNVLKYVSAIAIIMVVLSAWGVDTTAIVTGAGVLTLIIGLGCQSLVSDVVSGIFMLFEGDIKVGDVVVVNGWRGTVQQIGLRRTKIEDALGNVNIINNASISNIINNTRDLSVAVIDVGIEYGESIERVENILKDNFPLIKAELPSIVEGPFYKGVSALANSSVNIRIVAKCHENDKYQLERDLNRAVKLLFDKYNVNIPFDQIVINYRDEDEALAVASLSEKVMAKKFVEEQKKLSWDIEDQVD